MFNNFPSAKRGGGGVGETCFAQSTFTMKFSPTWLQICEGGMVSLLNRQSSKADVKNTIAFSRSLNSPAKRMRQGSGNVVFCTSVLCRA